MSNSIEELEIVIKYLVKEIDFEEKRLDQLDKDYEVDMISEESYHERTNRLVQIKDDLSVIRSRAQRRLDRLQHQV